MVYWFCVMTRGDARISAEIQLHGSMSKAKATGAEGVKTLSLLWMPRSVQVPKTSPKSEVLADHVNKCMPKLRAELGRRTPIPSACVTLAQPCLVTDGTKAL